MPCLQLKPFPVCGSHGECFTPTATENETISTFCKCEEGWSQSTEFNYFTPSDDIRTGNCFYNKIIIDYVLYGLVLISSLLALIALWCAIHNRKQLRRQAPNIISMIVFVPLSIYRISNPAEALIGEDVFFSVLVSISYAIFQVSIAIFFNKYIMYMLKKVEFVNKEKNQRRARILKNLSIVQMTIEVLTQQILWIICLTDRKSALSLLILFFSIELVSGIYLVILAKIAFGKVISDLENFIANREQSGKGPGVSSDMSRKEQKLARWAKNSLPKTKQVRDVIIISKSIFNILYILTLASEAFFQAWAYLIPLVMFISSALNIFIIRNMSKNGPKYKFTRTGSKEESYESSIANSTHASKNDLDSKNNSQLGSNTAAGV